MAILINLLTAFTVPLLPKPLHHLPQIPASVLHDLTRSPDSVLHCRPPVPAWLSPLRNQINQPSSDHERSYAPPMTRPKNASI
ncbi:hypothetical protein DWG96_24505 [Escherichia coli]|nr:hypothetical protein [Escherichia coli]